MNIVGTRKSIYMIKNFLDTTKSTVSPIEFQEKKPAFQPCKEKYFQRVTPESCGIESCRVYNYINKLVSNKSVGLQSIMLMRNDRVFFEADIGFHSSYYPRMTFSECKTIVALAIGVLLTQGKIKLSEKINEIFGDRIPPITKIRLNGLTVKHLLTMTAGITFNECEAMVTDDWLKAFLNSDIEGNFGEKFRYNSLNSYLLSAIIKERTGTGISEFLDETLFKELNIKEYYWEKCPGGIEKGGWGLYIRNEDIAKLGLLVMQKGIWNGKKLIASKYIINASSTQVDTPRHFGEYNYGYHMWCGRNDNSFLFNGMLGQNLLGFRSNGIIVVANCSNCDLFQQNDFFDLTRKYLSENFQKNLPENTKNAEMLLKYGDILARPANIKSFLDNSTEQRNLEADLDAIDGKQFVFSGANTSSAGFAPMTLQLIQGNFTKGLKSIGFQKNGNNLNLVFSEADEEYRLTIGFDRAVSNQISIHGEKYAINAFGKFATNEDGIPILRVDCYFVETPYDRTYKFYFNNDESYAVFTEEPGGMLAKNPRVLFGLLGQSGQTIENLLSKVDGDYLAIKFEKVFSPRLAMKELK